MLEANIKATYSMSLASAKDVYGSNMQEACTSNNGYAHK